MANTNDKNVFVDRDENLYSLGRRGRNYISLDVNNVQVVESQRDLPDQNSNGELELEDNTVYRISGFVPVDRPIRLGNQTPLIGGHASVDGIIHTGVQDCLRGTDKGLFMRDAYMHAPGGTIFNLSANTTTEILVESCSFADAAGLGNIGSLGTIEGFRVPSFKGCNFENFNAGLSFTGSPDKVFFSESPFRGVTESGVSCVTFDGSFSSEIITFYGCYVKGVQSDTKVIDYQGTVPSDVFQYSSITHDTSVTKSNILNGNVSVATTGFRVTDAYPLPDSTTTGIVTLDSPTEITINTQNTYEPVAGTSTLGVAERVTKSNGDSLVEVEGRRTIKLFVNFDSTITGQNGDIYETAITVNGTLRPESEIRVEARGQNAPVAVGSHAIEEMANGDTIGLRVRNTSSSNNVTFENYSLSITKA